MHAQLGLFDRGTLLLWRATNLTGWTALGVMLAIEVHWLVVQMFGFSQTARFHRGGAFSAELGAVTTARFLVARLVVTVIAAAAIGLLAGRKLFRWHSSMAAIGSAAYVLTVLIVLEHNVGGSSTVFGLVEGERSSLIDNSISRMALHDAIITLTVPAAAGVAARSYRKRRG